MSGKLKVVDLRRGLAPGRHFDGGGLYLEVTSGGGQYWRWKYRIHRRERRLAIGVYPTISLADARAARDEARRQLAAGIDPSAAKRAAKHAATEAAERTVAATARAWMATKSAPPRPWAKETQRKARLVWEDYLIPAIGQRPIAELRTPDVVPVLRAMSQTTPDLARKARQYLLAVVRYAISLGYREDGLLLSLEDAVTPAQTDHIPAATTPDGLAAVLRAIHGYSQPVTRAALLMCAYTAQRPGMVASMAWDDLRTDGSSGEWHIPAKKMKMRRPHIVPLPRQAQALIEEMRPYTAGRAHVFPPLARQKNQHLTRDTLSSALRKMGFRGEHATHGFRAALRTIARERLQIDTETIKAQLAHAKRGNVEQAYDRTEYTDARRIAMQQWADYLDTLIADSAL